MKRVYILAIVIALICGAIIFSVFSSQKKQQEEAMAEAQAIAEAKAATVTTIVTAAQDIPRGTAISQAYLTTIEVDKAILVSLDAATEIEQVIGHTATKDIFQGEVITNSSIELPGAQSERISYRIPAGLFALQIQASADNAVGEHIAQYDYVDLFYNPGAAMQAPVQEGGENQQQQQSQQQRTGAGDEKENTWELLAEHLQVIALGDHLYTGEGDYQYVILAMERAMVTKVLDASNAGQIKMVLNSSNEAAA